MARSKVTPSERKMFSLMGRIILGTIALVVAIQMILAFSWIGLITGVASFLYVAVLYFVGISK